MTFKRIITIILVLLVIVGLLLGVSWYMSRRNAQNNGETPISFREFLGIGSPSIPGAPTEGELSGEFTPEPGRTVKYDANNNGINDWREDLNGNGIPDKDEDFDGNGIPDGYEDFDGNGIPNWEDDYADPDTNNGGGAGDNGDNNNPFPTDPFTPPGSSGPGDSNGGGTTDPGGWEFPSDVFENPNNTPYDYPTIDPNALPAEYCSAADTNIEFTADELARLAQLQKRFNAIQESLYDTIAIADQQSLYDQLLQQRDSTSELLKICQDTSFPSSVSKRVMTPFYNTGNDAREFVRPSLQGEYLNFSDTRVRRIDSSDRVLYHPEWFVHVFENILRINIW